MCAVAVQNYITAILVFLVVEMFVTWGYYGSSLLLRAITQYLLY